MSLIVRKINRAKWNEGELRSHVDVPGDAVTSCLKTVTNALSVWRIDDASELDDVVLAIAAEGDHLESIDVAVMSEQSAIMSGLILASNPGKTPVMRMIHSHRDIQNLDYPSLGKVAQLIVEAFSQKSVRRYTKNQLRDIIDSAISKGDILVNDLKPSIQRKFPRL